jgi:hypothetical protein
VVQRKPWIIDVTRFYRCNIAINCNQPAFASQRFKNAARVATTTKCAIDVSTVFTTLGFTTPGFTNTQSRHRFIEENGGVEMLIHSIL